GLMAVKLAERAFERGSDVEMWMGGTSVQLPEYIPTKRFGSVSELEKLVESINHDIVIVPAALADFAPDTVEEGKIPSDKSFSVHLNPVPKVLPSIRKKCNLVIGFKAESGLSREDLIARAKKRMEEYDLNAVIANDIDVAGRSATSVILVTKDKEVDISGLKTKVANSIMDYCSSIL
ncbi:MAG: bifunctional phosphopantothenoylcysteine decarboxylase/phosphopantothenate--cysteine ligase CoaBC, partial [Candidatus Methanomethylophilaceae archaeon]|nr:bifunctional phosphopantothenoylcysteine decarboxylase/phosphopantothenate--cysteine ligase CoaBC [Candidatus Methanomethylophilaceae archaeon]